MKGDDIRQEWIRDYVDKLIAVAKTLDPQGAMYAATLFRVDAVLDLVKAFQETYCERS